MPCGKQPKECSSPGYPGHSTDRTNRHDGFRVHTLEPTSSRSGRSRRFREIRCALHLLHTSILSAFPPRCSIRTQNPYSPARGVIISYPALGRKGVRRQRPRSGNFSRWLGIRSVCKPLLLLPTVQATTVKQYYQDGWLADSPPPPKPPICPSRRSPDRAVTTLYGTPEEGTDDPLSPKQIPARNSRRGLSKCNRWLRV